MRLTPDDFRKELSGMTLSLQTTWGERHYLRLAPDAVDQVMAMVARLSAGAEGKPTLPALDGEGEGYAQQTKVDAEAEFTRTAEDAAREWLHENLAAITNAGYHARPHDFRDCVNRLAALLRSHRETGGTEKDKLVKRLVEAHKYLLARSYDPYSYEFPGLATTVLDAMIFIDRIGALAQPEIDRPHAGCAQCGTDITASDGDAFPCARPRCPIKPIISALPDMSK